ncbi:SDR family NAD(P)-dependent oxidoreductase [Pseudomaricurvus sp. HS19]|uniref:SDR family NAD(P)-dependent oxidoreductase n=1 Tax=Pseudomaricurvus sp. HS19 TaxID=2692626 RepID=UPI00136C107A|nr:SDR family NAD(P)-dependent oxidoreductase [Pseudomaricurvus sp. HS19]MYM61948.1 SDR family NAD(P)-dependent oxidoreductase [Pseudomaricurvus sp. HS19]
MSKPIAVITGASSGIGKEAARELLLQGWQVIALGRDPARCEQAAMELQSACDRPQQLHFIGADLAQMSSVVQAANTIRSLTDRVDVLLNNAGGLTRELTLTDEGNENTFASNHLGHFLLTNELLPLLQKAASNAPAGHTRIVLVSSSAHEHCDGLDWDDLQSQQDFDSNRAYCRVKLANLLHMRELARRLQADGIRVHAMHPGLVNSNFASHADSAMQSYFEANAARGITPAAAADTLIWLASAEEAGLTTGEYFHQRQAIPCSALAQDDDAAAQLWQESERLVERARSHR